MVWVNPLTGKKEFQGHGICVRKLYLRSSPDEKPRVVEDIGEICKFILGIQNRILRPEYIPLAPAEGDVVILDNYRLFHSAVDHLLELGSRSMHQASIGDSVGPKGPVLIDVST
ncbi:hypothetical protein MPDQ_007245 [Monascus purpureus]|uniref:TauD/TfdA-like domain-containing protein n=1 Tax=Monascus purpureus TaxID=5098 RepID=A0A507QW75_MONPU|nr:hypothetical protein MPDQ_007245 [Monascus purpureus]BDD57667.1 hypothetical protein MAP00_003014 [Monascus purpureus]